ncbi:potassium channel family protein [Pseudomonas sp. 2835]|uniref:potassium channel family protein n=1 Tax=Pseudomonas sp. 2835 TaxID=3156451 RepID=UPI003D1DC623
MKMEAGFDKRKLWALPAERFNDWRRKNDYPIIYERISKFLPFFQEWQKDAGVTQELMFEFGIGRFLGSEDRLSVFHYHGGNRRAFLTDDSTILHLRDPRNTYKEDIYLPYFKWLRMEKGEERFEKVSREFRLKHYRGGKPVFNGDFFLLDLSVPELKGVSVSDKLLDFVCLDETHFDSIHNNTRIYIWYSTAKKLKVTGDLWHLSFYETQISDFDVNNTLVLNNGVFGGWEIDCEFLRLTIARGVFRDSRIRCSKLDYNFELSEVSDVGFSYVCLSGRSRWDEVRFNRKAKLLFSAQGDHFNAGQYFYREKVSQLKAHASPWSDLKLKHGRPRWSEALSYVLKSYFSLVYEFFAFVTWGFGERPGRSLLASIAVILVCAITFYCGADSVTSGKFADSLYFSMVTFVTLGYGDISQKVAIYKIFSAAEAFLGMVLMGLFLAGYASKSKQY